MSNLSATAPSAAIQATQTDGVLTIAISGRLDANTTARVWPQATQAMAEAGPGGSVVVDVSDVPYCDGAGMGLLLDLRCRAHDAGTGFTLAGAMARSTGTQ